jgi:hypothetical protein
MCQSFLNKVGWVSITLKIFQFDGQENTMEEQILLYGYL